MAKTLLEDKGGIAFCGECQRSALIGPPQVPLQNHPSSVAQLGTRTDSARQEQTLCSTALSSVGHLAVSVTAKIAYIWGGGRSTARFAKLPPPQRRDLRRPAE